MTHVWRMVSPNKVGGSIYGKSNRYEPGADVLPAEHSPSALAFRVIALAQYGSIAVVFRRDSFAAAARVEPPEGTREEGYLDWLRERLRVHPRGHVHLGTEDEIIGQLEARPLPGAPRVG